MKKTTLYIAFIGLSIFWAGSLYAQIKEGGGFELNSVSYPPCEDQEFTFDVVTGTGLIDTASRNCPALSMEFDGVLPPDTIRVDGLAYGGSNDLNYAFQQYEMPPVYTVIGLVVEAWKGGDWVFACDYMDVTGSEAYGESFMDIWESGTTNAVRSFGNASESLQVSISTSLQMHCTDEFPLGLYGYSDPERGFRWAFYYVPYDTRTNSTASSTGGTSAYTLQEWLFVSCVGLFLLSLMTWKYLFRPSKDIL